MRLAIAACAIALAIFAAVVGFLVINNPALLSNEPAPAPAIKAESRPTPQTVVTVVSEPPTVTAPAPAAAPPAPAVATPAAVDTSPTIAQRTTPVESPLPPSFAQAAPPPAAA